MHPWVGKIPWRREWIPTPVFLPGESHGQRSLAGFSPWGCRESDMTEWHTHTQKPNRRRERIGGPQGLREEPQPHQRYISDFLGDQVAKTLLSQGKCVGSKPGQGTRSHMLQLRPGDVCMLLCPTLCGPWTVPPPGSSVHGILQANYAGLGCCTLLQGIFPTQGSNPRLYVSCMDRRLLYH